MTFDDAVQTTAGGLQRERDNGFYHDLFNNMGSTVLVIDSGTGAILDANRAASDLYGYSHAQLTQLKIFDLNALPPVNTREIVRKIALGQIKHMIVPHRLANGEIRQVDIRLGRIIREGQTVNIAAINDITVQIQAQNALKESEARYRSHYKSLPVAAYTWKIKDDDFILIDLNDAALALSTDAYKDCLGRSVRELYQDQPFVENGLKQCSTTREMVHCEEKAILHATKEVRDVDLTFVFLEPDLVVIHIQDVTQRNKANRELRESEERFSKIFSSSYDAISLSTLADDVVIEANPAFCSIFDLPRDEVVGRTRSQLDLWVDPQLCEEMINTVRERGLAETLEVEYRSPSGRCGFMLVTANIVNVSGVDCLLLVQRDITVRRQAEENVKHVSRELAKALVAKDEFLAAMSHELRTPLTIILGFAEAMQMPHYAPITEKQQQAILSIEKSSQRLLTLLNDILDYTKVQSGSIELLRSPTSLAEACHFAMQTVAPQVEAKKQQILFMMVPKEIILQVDEKYLGTILNHLLANASKFTPENGKIGIQVSGSRESSQVRLVVWDTGIGIPEADLSRIFNPFVQLDASLARRYEGTGLGLALVKAFVESFGGHIEAESTVGKGSRFIVTLPWTDQNMYTE